MYLKTMLQSEMYNLHLLPT